MSRNLQTVAVDSHTRLCLEDGAPYAIETTRTNLDHAVESAEEYLGHPLEVGRWASLNDGRWMSAWVALRTAQEENS